MAANPLSALRKQTLHSTDDGAEEAVTVNTRALIDKVLARYSSEHTTLRELIQNAADACATSVEVRYYSSAADDREDGESLAKMQVVDAAGLQELVKKKIRRLVVKNDGMPFRDQDWSRLKRIAEGNPSDEKIGAFGVGFYSVFADCDEPFVSSGNAAMAFFWRGNSLFTRRAKLQTREDWTTFLLDHREPGDLPDLRSLCKFFATSLTFVKLERISLWMDDLLLCELRKKELPPATLGIPSSVHPKTKDGIAQITAVETANVQLDARYMNVTHYQPEKPPSAEGAFGGLGRLFFGRAAATQQQKKSNITATNLHDYTTASIFLRIATATIATSVGAKFAAELERATKKPPPKRTTISCLTMSKDELDASESESDIFSGVVPTKNGRIFIGFPTHQTTGIKAHFAAHSVIPTVERENIDLNARIVKTWNAELLRAAGILARIIYVDEMEMLRKRTAGLKPADLQELYAHAVHIMRQFTFEDSTPSLNVGNYVAEAFWSATYYTSIELLSTRGVLSSTKVRLADRVTFLEGLPLLPEALIKGAPEFVDTLRKGGFITEITFTDIQNSLADRPLSSEQSHAFLKWLSVEIQTGKLDDLQASMLLSGAIAMVPILNDKGEEVENGLAVPVSLAAIKYYVHVGRLAADIPLPPDCLPFALSKRLAIMDFDALGWKELEVGRWVAYVAARATNSGMSADHNIALSPAFAIKVLGIVSKNWDKLPADQKASIVDILSTKPCMPTKHGMKLPKEAYFPNVKLFPDLPVIHEVRNIKDKLLIALGVRKTVELTLVLERLMGGGGGGSGEKWSHVDLIKYLTSVRDDIPAEDIRKLHSVAICKTASDSTKLYKVNELYDPLDSLLKLGLPLLYWPGEWRAQSLEVAFLRRLGLRKYPTETTLIQLAAGQDQQLREMALRYLLDQFTANSYSTTTIKASQKAFLPLQKGGKDRLVRPCDCFTNPDSALLNFPVLRADLAAHAAKLGVATDPPIDECVSRLIASPPTTAQEARDMFSYMLPFASRISQRHLSALNSALIIPLPPPWPARTTPKQCYLGPSTHKYAGLFPFVNFGSSADSFLLICGCRAEPDTRELAFRLADDPNSFAQDEERSLGLLRAIADEWPTLKQDRNLVSRLQSSACLAAYRTSDKTDGEGGGVGKRTFVLGCAAEVYLIDDISLHGLFRNSLLAAPEDDRLESLYSALGSHTLSSAVEKTAAMGAALPGEQEDLRKLVIERVALFLEGNPEDLIRDAAWVERHLSVKGVASISYRMTFRGGVDKISVSKVVQRTAAVAVGKEGCLLWVTKDPEYYLIAQGMVKVLLKRPKPHSALLLESLLATDLERLIGRGYNVARILRRRDEERKQKLAQLKQTKEEQEKRAQAQHERLKEHQQELERKKAADEKTTRRLHEIPKVPESPTDRAPMPGAFTLSSPPPPLPIAAPPAIAAGGSGGFLSRGLSRFSQLLSDEKPQPPQAPTVNKPQSGARPIGEGSQPSTPRDVTASLQEAIRGLHPHTNQTLISSSNPLPPPPPESPTNCAAPKTLTYILTTPSGARVYSHVATSMLSREDMQGVEAFSILLKDVMAVFGGGSVAVYMGSLEGEQAGKGGTIAFNSGGSVFCNYAFFESLHRSPAMKAEAFKFWFVTMCHELAHNLVGQHGAAHSYFTESFVSEYFSAAAARLMAIEQQQGAGRPPAYRA